MTGVFRALDLEGERGRPDREDAVHWVSVYDELIGACREFLAGMDDRPHVATRMHEFEERRAFWMDLLKE